MTAQQRYRQKHRERVLAAQRLRNQKYYRENREKILERAKVRAKRDAGYLKLYQAQYYWKNRERLCRAVAQKGAERKQVDAAYRLLSNLRSRLNEALKRCSKDIKAKSATTMQLVGVPMEFLIAWLEIQFKPGMTWENYGPVWHVDHIEPCFCFDMSSLAEQKKCFWFWNLQPLFADENRKKGIRKIWL